MSNRSAGRLLLPSLAVAAFSYGLNQAILTPLISSIEEEYGVGLQQATWLVTGFLLVGCVIVPLAARLGDMYGHARVLRVVMLVFAIGGVLAAAVTTFPFLLAARLVQGAGAALFPLGYALVRGRSTRTRLAGSIGLISSTAALGSSIGTAVSGPTVAVYAVRGALVVAAAVGLIATATVLLAVAGPLLSPDGPIDWLGAALLALWTTAILMVISEGRLWGVGSPPTIALGAVAVLSFVVWTLVEHRAKVPLVDLPLMSTTPMILSNLIAFAFGYLLFSGLLVIPAFVQSDRSQGFGFSASVGQTAWFVLPQTLLLLVTGLFAAPMARRIGSAKSVVLGTMITLLGQVSLLLLHDHPWHVMAAGALLGVGIGITFTHLATVVLEFVPAGAAASASGANTNIRNIGGTVGTQVGALLVLASPGAQGYVAVFLSLTIVAAVAIPASVWLARMIPGSGDPRES